MKRYLLYSSLVLVLGLVAILTFTQRAQTQSIPENATSETTQVTSSTMPVFSYQGQLLDNNGDPVSNTIPMTFKLYSQATGGTACWTESYTGSNKVVVENGRFSVLLGSITPINTDCLNDNSVYIELTINSEILSPRKLLTDVHSSWQTGNVPAGATLHNSTVGEDLSFEGSSIIGMEDNRLYLSADRDALYSDTNWPRSSWLWLSSLDNSDTKGSARLHIARDNTINNEPYFDVVLIEDNGASAQLFEVQHDGDAIIEGDAIVQDVLRVRGAGNASMEMGQATGSGVFYFDLVEGNQVIFRDRTGSSSDPFFRIYNNGDAVIYGNLSLSGTCSAAAIEDEKSVTSADTNCVAGIISAGSIETGAHIEINLMTPLEQQQKNIDRFEQGDLLCSSPKTNQLEKCSQANDPLIMAVASATGKPIILGAEPIKVIGPVQHGDYLVASSVPGYAIATQNPTFGIVIAQALENFNGEQGLVLAMIRKM